jgi:8-oxo-dGTP pyrophosphatase MutT (NUDIX family)
MASVSPITPTVSPPAVAAILVTPAHRYLLQHRDNRPDIWDPDRWGLFGGSIDPGESPEEALARELAEELELRPQAQATYFTQIAWDYGFCGHGVKLRYYYAVQITAAEIDTLVQHEGQGMRIFAAQEILHEPKLTAYDAHALRMHIAFAP